MVVDDEISAPYISSSWIPSERMLYSPNLSPFPWYHIARITRKPNPTSIKKRSIRRPLAVPYYNRFLQRGLECLMDGLVREYDVQKGFEFE